MRLKKIIYVTRLTIPRKDPRSIQILKNCAALSGQNIEVFLYVKKNNFPNIDSLSRYYGIQASQGLHIETLPLLVRFSSTLIALFFCVKTILNKNGVIFYVRDFTLAERIIKLKWLHKINILAETHCTPLMYNNRLILANKAPTRRGKAESVEFVHKNSDGLICAFKETEEFLLNNNIQTPTVCAWFGTEPKVVFDYDFSSRKGIYYIGSFSKSHSPELFIEAMKYVKDESLILMGGYSEEKISSVKDYAKRAGVSDRVIFENYVPPAEVGNHLKQAKVAIALWAGLKLTDYFSHGLPIVACSNPGKGILRDNDNCILFQPKYPKSLADALNKIFNNPVLAKTLARNAYKTAQEYSWQKRAEKIVNFIENNIG